MAIARLWILFHCIRCDLSSWNQIESPRTRLAFEEMFVNRLWVLMEVELGDCAGCGVHKDRNIYIYVFTEEVGVAGNYCAVLIQRRKHKVSLL